MSPRAPVRSAKLKGTAKSPTSTGRAPVLVSVSVHSSASPASAKVCCTVRSAGATSCGSGPTRHSARLTVDSGATVTSTRIAIVFTGAKLTDVKALASRAYGDVADTGFHSRPS